VTAYFAPEHVTFSKKRPLTGRCYWFPCRCENGVSHRPPTDARRKGVSHRTPEAGVEKGVWHQIYDIRNKNQ